MENIEVDKKEFVNQTKEKIKNSGKYLEYSALVPGDDAGIPLISFEPHNIGPFEVGMLLFAIENSIESIIDMPGVKEAYQKIKEHNFKVKNFSIEVDDKDETN